MMDLLARFRAEPPTPDGANSAELFLGRHPRLAFEPRRTHDDTQSVEPPARRADPNAGCNRRSCTFDDQRSGSRAFHKVDTVRVRRPTCATRKGQSPYSGVLTVTDVLGRYAPYGQHTQVHQPVDLLLRHRTDTSCRPSCRTQTTQTTDDRPTSSSILTQADISRRG